MSVLRVQTITNEVGSGGPEFATGATFPPTQNFSQNDLTLNSTGIVTANTLVASNINVVGIMTGTFVGNGFNVTNLPGTKIQKAIGLHLIT